MAKASSARVARKQAAKGTTKPQNKSGSNMPDGDNYNAMLDAQIKIVRDTVALNVTRENDILTGRQIIAKAIMEYIALKVGSGVKMEGWSSLFSRTENTTRTKWLSAMTVAFLGKAPQSKAKKDGIWSQDMADASADYKANVRKFRDAAELAICLGYKGHGPDRFDAGAQQFIVTVDDVTPPNTSPLMGLAAIAKQGGNILLANKPFQVGTADNKMKSIRSSASHFVAMCYPTEAKQAAGSGDNDNGNGGDTSEGGGANERDDGVDAVTRRKVVKALMLDEAAEAMLRALTDDPDAKNTPEALGTTTWNRLTEIAQRLGKIVEAQHAAETAAGKRPARKRAA